MNIPNFFILGAPKCGTTSMVDWLDEHPEIFMSPSKEPHFYNTDHSHNVITDRTQYLNLFKKATKRHRIIGEASVWYLYSKDAVENIIADYGNEVKYLVMLRNPVSMAYSLHEQQVFNLNEPEVDFELAWNLQKDRANGDNIGSTTRDAKLLLYGEACKLGKQVQNLLEKVDRNKIKFVLVDDLKQDSEKTYCEVLQFLEVDNFKKNDFKAVNTAKVRKSKKIAFLVKIFGLFKKYLKINKGLGLLNRLNKINAKNTKRKPLSNKMSNLLKDFFKDDIILLAKLIERDLSSWLK